MDRFDWRPGEGLDGTALARLRSHFRKPRSPMGEGWFMGDRRIFHELSGDLTTLGAGDLQRPLSEIASGTGSFGPLREWEEWYHYLLAQLLPRSHEASSSSLLELLVTGFMAVYPNGLQNAPYRQFQDDILLTLGRCMMDRGCWNERDIIVGTILRRSNNNPAGIWRWWDASGDLSASMFFCLKYYPPQYVRGWLQSVFAISSPHWRSQIMVWLVGAHSILSGMVRWPSQWPENSRPAVYWDWSHCLRPQLAVDKEDAEVLVEFLPEKSRMLALQAIREHFTAEVFLDWLDSISTVSYLADELAEIPSIFESLYVQSS